MQTKLDVYRDFYNLDHDGEVILTHAIRGHFSEQLGGKMQIQIFESLLEELGIQAEMTRDQIVSCMDSLISPDNEKAAIVIGRQMELLINNKHVGVTQLHKERERLFAETRKCFDGLMVRIKKFCEQEDEM